MNTGTELTRQEPGAIAVPTVIDIISKMADSPTFSLEAVQAIKELVALQERQDDLRRKSEFAAAMSRLHGAMPKINKDGKIVIAGKDGKPGSTTRFSRLEDIDAAIRPLLKEEGMSLSFDTQWLEGRIMVIGKLSHTNGHFETKQIPLPIDVSGSKNNVQGAGSTVSYGRRYLVKMFFNIIEDGEDNDGNGPVKTITQKQADELNDLITEIGGDARGKILAWAKVSKISELPAGKFDGAMSALLKRRAQ